MEYIVLAGEVPPLSPKEWTHSSSEMNLGSTELIPLFDVSI